MRAGAYELGPGSAELRVLTRREGMAARAGPALVLVVADWRARLALGDAGSLELTADGGSLEVRSGSGGVRPLSDRDRRDIGRNIDGKVLRGAGIAYRASAVHADGDTLRFEGTLRIGYVARPADLAVRVGDDGRFSGRHELRQTDFGITPYSGLLGTLKLRDEVTVEIEGVLG